MTNTPNPAQFFEDMAKMAGGAFGAAGNLKDEAGNFFENQMEFLCQKFGLVRASELAALEARVIALEAKVAALEAAASA